MKTNGAICDDYVKEKLNNINHYFKVSTKLNVKVLSNNISIKVRDYQIIN